MMSRIGYLILTLTLVLFFLFLLFQLADFPARAVDLTVLNTNDSGTGSLREAISLAGDGDTILFDSSLIGQTITLTSGQLLITKNLTISGPDANLLAISGNSNSRVFLISATVTISGVTIMGGAPIDCGGGISNSGIVNLTNSVVSGNTALFNNDNLSGGCGGGISNSGIVNLTNSTVSGNTATNPGGFGGGIVNHGTVNLTNSTIFGNMAHNGGGIMSFFGTINLTNSTVFSNTVFFNDGGGIVVLNGEANLTNSTVSGNTASRFGGGIWSSGSVSLINSTVSGNTAGNDGGGIYNGFETMALTNTILAYNQVISTTNDCANLGGTVTSGGYNLVQVPGNCVFTSTGDITNTNPLLSPLADHGGATLTHALLNGSPAIDHIPNGANGCGTTIATDQRGVVRPQVLGCDIGAYEAYEFVYLNLPLIFSN